MRLWQLAPPEAILAPTTDEQFLLVQNNDNFLEDGHSDCPANVSRRVGFSAPVTRLNRRCLFAVAASDEAVIGGFPAAVYNDGNGNLAISQPTVPWTSR